MSRVRVLAAVVAATALLVAGGCSSDSNDSTKTSEKALEFGTGAAGATRVGVCSAFPIPNMKKVVGGGKTFRVLPPSAIGEKGDPVTGEVCSWERRGPGSKVRSLQVEARNYGDDVQALVGQMADLRSKTEGAADVANLGDQAFATSSPASTLLQVRKGAYFLTFASRGEGGLEPVPLATLQYMASVALAKV